MKKTVYIILALVLLLPSCQREGLKEAYVEFSVPSVPQVKAIPLDFGSDTPGTVYLPTDMDLGFVACKYTSSGALASAWTVYSSPAVLQAVYDGGRGNNSSGKWVPSTRLLWPGAGNYVRYFGYAPYGATGVTVNASAGAAPTINFTVPASYENQVDLLVTDSGSSREWDGNPPVTAIDVPLNFVHALTGIRFRVGAGYSVTSVSVNGIYDTGTLTLGSDPAWTGNTGNASYTISSPSLKADPSDPTFNLFDDVYTLLLMPQTLPAGATIVATISDGSGSKTITAIAAGLVWQPGRMITYTIKESDISWTEAYMRGDTDWF